MSPLSRDLLNRKRQFILLELKLLDRLLDIRKTMQVDVVVEHALCHVLQNILAAIIEVAQRIVAERLGAVPESYADSIEKLAELNLLDGAFAAEFARAAKLRNVVVHAYENLKMDLVWTAAEKLWKDSLTFLGAIDKV